MNRRMKGLIAVLVTVGALASLRVGIDMRNEWRRMPALNDASIVDAQAVGTCADEVMWRVRYDLNGDGEPDHVAIYGHENLRRPYIVADRDGDKPQPKTLYIDRNRDGIVDERLKWGDELARVNPCVMLQLEPASVPRG